MKDEQDRLRGRLAGNGWRVVTETTASLEGEGTYATAWRLASLTPPVGRQVLVEFRVHEIEVQQWWREEYRRVVRYYVAVRFPTSAESPEALLEGGEAEANDFRQVFRVLEWFRDPTGHNLYQNAWENAWFPPESWDPARWQPGAGLEACWDTTVAVGEMLHYVIPHLSERKLRLFACAVCRRLPVSMLDEKNRVAVEAAERYAEGMIPKRELKRLSKLSGLAWLGQLEARGWLAQGVGQLNHEDPVHSMAVAAEALREVVGNPFRPVARRHAWLRANGGLVGRLVESARAEQDFAVLPVLADALEDAGCQETALLEHCRQARPHARGCWALDVLAGVS
jgi:hypothetical protein